MVCTKTPKELVNIEKVGALSPYAPLWLRDRALACRRCDENEDGVCRLVKEKHPDREALINVGIRMPFVKCPKDPPEWNRQAGPCPTCGRIVQLQSQFEECKWCVNKRRLRPQAFDRPPPEALIKSGDLECAGCLRRVQALSEHQLCALCENKNILALDRARERTKQKERVHRAGGSFRTIDRHGVRFITEAQFAADTLDLVGLVPPNIRSVIGVARSGLSAAVRVAMYLNLPLYALRQTRGDIVDAGNGWRLGGQQTDTPPRENALVVDDTSMTGNSLMAIRPVLHRYLDSYTTAAVYVNPLSNHKPDIWAIDLQWPHLLEWNLFNSVLSPNTATDFDGVLCHDCPPGDDDDGPRYLNFIENAQPRYLTRRTPIPLIVTARIEKYRRPTEQWLRRHGVQFQQLVMHPARTLRERMRDDISSYKARHFQNWAQVHRARPAPSLFVESEDAQARRIAQLTGRLVVCPSTGQCYWK